MRSKRKGLVLGIISLSFTAMSFSSIVSMWLCYFLGGKGYYDGLGGSFSILMLIYVIALTVSCFLFVIPAIVLNIINIIKANKIFRIIAIANLLFDLCLFCLYINVFLY